MKIYHYTKTIKLNSIFEDGFLATEGERSLNSISHITNYVWLTEKTSYPKTALPLVPMFLETNLITHLQHKNVFVDLDKIGSVFGKFYRFSFESSDARLKKWFFSNERNLLQHNSIWSQMESKANKVGDDVRSFWISANRIALENFSLEVFENGKWNYVLQNTTLSNLNTSDTQVIEKLKCESIAKCEELGIPFQYLMAA